MHITHEHLVKAFKSWEGDLRANPRGYMAYDEVSKMDPDELAEKSACLFEEVLKQVGAE